MHFLTTGLSKKEVYGVDVVIGKFQVLGVYYFISFSGVFRCIFYFFSPMDLGVGLCKKGVGVYKKFHNPWLN